MGDAARLPVLEDFKIGGFQAADAVPFGVGDHHLHLHQVHVDACQGLLRETGRKRGQQGNQGRNGQPAVTADRLTGAAGRPAAASPLHAV